MRPRLLYREGQVKQVLEHVRHHDLVRVRVRVRVTARAKVGVRVRVRVKVRVRVRAHPVEGGGREHREVVGGALEED